MKKVLSFTVAAVMGLTIGIDTTSMQAYAAETVRTLNLGVPSEDLEYSWEEDGCVVVCDGIEYNGNGCSVRTYPDGRWQFAIRTGDEYQFLERYNTEPDGSGVDYGFDEEIDPDEVSTLYAVWDAPNDDAWDDDEDCEDECEDEDCEDEDEDWEDDEEDCDDEDEDCEEDYDDEDCDDEDWEDDEDEDEDEDCEDDDEDCEDDDEDCEDEYDDEDTEDDDEDCEDEEDEDIEGSSDMTESEDPADDDDRYTEPCENAAENSEESQLPDQNSTPGTVDEPVPVVSDAPFILDIDEEDLQDSAENEATDNADDKAGSDPAAQDAQMVNPAEADKDESTAEPVPQSEASNAKAGDIITIRAELHDMTYTTNVEYVDIEMPSRTEGDQMHDVQPLTSDNEKVFGKRLDHAVQTGDHVPAGLCAAVGLLLASLAVLAIIFRKPEAMKKIRTRIRDQRL